MNVFEIFAKLGLDTKEYEDGLGESEKQGKSTGSKIQNVMSKVASASKKAIAASATAVTAITGLGVKEYAEYEQLVGGVDTLFENSSKKVQEYAANAYKTAGMSANQYMDTVTSFSASLLQSLGGDTDKAADVANQAITDMSDNANKMGTSMESIQNAYQGFAKQNYTMLDNLKLGYGGTKTEMERLLADAEKISGIKYDISSYADITEAIHVVQTEMGITGTTAKEAATTIEGSTNMMKASWKNLLVGMADDTQQVGPLVEQLVDSAKTFGDNVIPRIQKTLTGIGEAIEYAVPVIAQELPGTIASIAPGMISAVGSLFTSVGSAAIQYAPTLIDTGITAVSQLITGFAQGLDSGIPSVLAKALPMLVEFSGQLRENAGTLVDAGLTLLEHLATGIANSIPVIVQTVPTIITNLAGIINDNAPKLITSGAKIIAQLVIGLVKAIPVIIQSIPQIITAIVSVFTAFNWVNIGKNIITGLKKGITTMKSAAKTAADNIKKSIVDAIKNLPETLKSYGKNGISGIGSALRAGVSMLGSVAKSILNAIVSAITGLPSRLLTIGKDAVSKVKNAFTSISWKDIGTNLIKGVASGITAGISWVVSAAKKAISKATSSAKKEADIESPSKKWRKEIGHMLPQGAAQGIEEDDSPEKAAQDKISSILEAAKSKASMASDLYTGYTTQKTNVGTTDESSVIGFLQAILEELQTINDEMFDRIVQALESVGIKINKRELARLVREVS